MKKRIEIISLIVSIFSIAFALYFCVEMVQVSIFRYGMTIIPFVINAFVLTISITLLIISVCVSICRRKKYNVVPPIIMESIATLINISNIILILMAFSH